MSLPGRVCGIMCQVRPTQMFPSTLVIQQCPSRKRENVKTNYKISKTALSIITPRMTKTILSGYVKIAIENGPVEIVDLPIDSMVDLSSSL